MDLVAIVKKLARDAGKLDFGPQVTHVYNPADYARENDVVLGHFGDVLMEAAP